MFELTTGNYVNWYMMKAQTLPEQRLRFRVP